MSTMKVIISQHQSRQSEEEKGGGQEPQREGQSSNIVAAHASIDRSQPQVQGDCESERP